MIYVAVAARCAYMLPPDGLLRVRGCMLFLSRSVICGLCRLMRGTIGHLTLSRVMIMIIRRSVVVMQGQELSLPFWAYRPALQHSEAVQGVSQAPSLFVSLTLLWLLLSEDRVLSDAHMLAVSFSCIQQKPA